MPFLCCKDCGYCYQLQPGESPNDYGSCHCGGEIFYTETLPVDYTDYEYQDEVYGKNIKIRRNKLILLSPLLIIIVVLAGLMAVYMPIDLISGKSPAVIGSDYRGQVTKEVYPSNTSAKTKTVVVVTGIHPREKLSIQVGNNLVKQYTLDSDEQIIHYKIKVMDHPDDFNTGRSNGEGLAAQYVLPDIKRTQADVVIVCHDHQPGYGEGYFLATPKMDGESVALAELIKNDLKDFNYYKSNINSEHGTSTIKFSNPLAEAGYRTLVYELPGLDTYQKAYSETKQLLGSTFKVI